MPFTSADSEKGAPSQAGWNVTCAPAAEAANPGTAGVASAASAEAIIHIFDELNGDEGILVASKIADRVGITRSVIVNALRKFESAGVIESRSSGMKGTYIKVLNDYIFDELDEIKARKNLKGKGDAHPDEAKK